MANTLQRFSQRARITLQLAQDEAQRLSHNYIGTEHLLLGMVREENGIAGRVLRGLGAEPEQVAKLVERMTGVGPSVKTQQLDLTPRTKQVIEFAVDEARKLGHNYIGTEHLLLGLIRQPDGVAIDILRQLGLTADRVRGEVFRVMAQAEGDEAGESGDARVIEDEPKMAMPSLAKLLAERDWTVAEDLFQTQQVVATKITAFNQGGVIVDFGQLRGFVAESQLSPVHQQRVRDADLPPERRFMTLLGLTALIKVIEIDRKQDRLILSER